MFKNKQRPRRSNFKPVPVPRSRFWGWATLAMVLAQSYWDEARAFARADETDPRL